MKKFDDQAKQSAAVNCNDTISNLARPWTYFQFYENIISVSLHIVRTYQILFLKIVEIYLKIAYNNFALKSDYIACTILAHILRDSSVNLPQPAFHLLLGNFVWTFSISLKQSRHAQWFYGLLLLMFFVWVLCCDDDVYIYADGGGMRCLIQVRCRKHSTILHTFNLLKVVEDEVVGVVCTHWKYAIIILG